MASIGTGSSYDDPNEKIVMTPGGKTATSTRIFIDRCLIKTEPEQAPEGGAAPSRYVAGGDHQGIIVNKRPVQENGGDAASGADISLEFIVFLVNHQTSTHSREARSLRFYFKDIVPMAEKPGIAQSFFTELVSPSDFPRDYVGFIKKIMKLMQRKYSALRRLELELRQVADVGGIPLADAHPSPTDLDTSTDTETAPELTETRLLELIESAYPNALSVPLMVSHFQLDSESELVPHLEPLMAQGLVKAVEGGYTRISSDEPEVKRVRQMPTIASKAQPTIALITVNYMEKVAVDAMIENKETFMRFSTAVGERNVYTLGNIGAHRVVSTKLPQVGHSRSAMIAAGSTTTRLLGTFQKVDHVILCGVGGGVPHYTDGGEHVRLGDVVVSCTPSRKGIYLYCREAQQKGVLKGEGPGDSLHHSEWTFDVEFMSPDSPYLQDVTETLIREYQETGDAPWLNYMEAALANEAESLAAEGKESTAVLSRFNRPPPSTDRLYMGIGGGDIIEVQHPPLPDPRYETEPRLHVAPIGCGRAALADQSARQSFAAQYELKGFDSEFDQVMQSIMGNRKDGFLVIRGISDYRDGSRGKEWQPYSALAAAGVMKAVICAMEPPGV